MCADLADLKEYSFNISQRQHGLVERENTHPDPSSATEALSGVWASNLALSLSAQERQDLAELKGGLINEKMLA